VRVAGILEAQGVLAFFLVTKVLAGDILPTAAAKILAVNVM